MAELHGTNWAATVDAALSGSVAPLASPSLAAELAPLCSATEVAELSAAMAAIPPGTPGRERRLCQELSFAARSSVEQIGALLSRLALHAEPFVNLVTDAVRGDTVILIPPVTKCVACGHAELSDARRGERRRLMGKPNHPGLGSAALLARGVGTSIPSPAGGLRAVGLSFVGLSGLVRLQ